MDNVIGGLTGSLSASNNSYIIQSGSAATGGFTYTDNTGYISIYPNQYSQQYGAVQGTSSLPVQITSGTYTWPEEKDEIKSKPTIPTDKDGHDIQCRFKVEAYKVVCEYFCGHCDTVLFSKVICKIPKKHLKDKCLPKLLKGV